MPPPDEDELREGSAGSIVRDEVEYTEDSTEAKYWDRQQAYKFLSVNDSLISLGQPADSDFENFMDTEKNTEIGKSNEVYQYISKDQLDSAAAANAGRSGANAMDENSITVSNLYLKYLGGDALTPADSTVLNEIAWADPFKGGEAAYMARVFLGIDPTSIETVTRISKTENEQFAAISKTLGLTVYPNPAADLLTVEIEDTPDNTFELIVLDGTGKEVLNRVPEQISQLDVKTWADGLYLLIIRKDGVNINEQKLIIRH